MTLEEQRASVLEAVERMSEAQKAIEDASEDADLADLEARFDATAEEHRKAKAALARAESVEEARKAAPVDPVGVEPARSPEVSVTKEELTYLRGGKFSILRDIRNAKAGDGKAQERLARHSQEMAEEERTNWWLDGSKMNAEERAINTTDGTGGEFVPPLWLQEQWVKVAKAGRATADTLNKQPLPPGTDTINLPTVSTATSVAVQTDGGSVSSTDLATSSVTGAVQTIAGQQDVSIQLVDLSVPSIDQVVFDDLVREYAKQLDTKVINGSVTNAKGLNQLTGTNGVTYTDATPTVPELYSKVADAIQQVHTGRFSPPTVVVMHPRRWGWFLASLDSNNRPLIVPSGPAFNQAGVLENVAPESVVGQLQGLPVVVDANVPINLGAGTNEDRIFVYSAPDIYLYESEPKLRVFGEVLSGTLQVRYQLYGYYSIIAGRYAKATSVISGTGLITPTF